MEFQDDELQEILNIFRTESEEIVTRLNDTLLKLEKTPDNKDLIVLLFRDAHSLKGAARMIGFNKTQEIAHALEDILGLAKEDNLVINSEIADIMYKSVDMISKIINQSIDNGKEIYDNKEVQEHINLLKNIHNNTEEIKVEEPLKIDPEQVLDTEPESVLINNIERINYLIVESLICTIKLTDKVEEATISDLYKNVSELTDYFEKINNFDIKNELETIKLKLDIVLKLHSTLTNNELEEIQKRTDKILNTLTDLCRNNSLEIIDYYEYAFSGKSYGKNQDEQTLESNTEIKYNFDDIKDNLQSISVSSERLQEIISFLNDIRNNFKDESFYSLLEKIIDLLEFVHKINAKFDDSQTEIITNALSFCFAGMNKQETTENAELLEQQITVVKQLIEISNPTTDVEISPANKTPNNAQKAFKDFSKLLNTEEIKTLHVDSAKLDIMVNQIGELISAKIKSTKQLNELMLAEKQFKECLQNYTTLIKNLKIYENKKWQTNSTDNSTSAFVKQFINSFSEQNKKFEEIINIYDKHLHTSAENDTKIKTLIDDFDNIIKNIRVLPLATVFHMFGRMVRDIANERGKEIEFTITGSEISADKKIIEEIKNPLIHIIRNSIDHGIETPERRKELGKSPTGHLQINAKSADNKIYIEVKDDGQGFNIQKIKDKAIQKGLLTPEELNNMSDDEIINIVFLPGFTTGDEITSISGRGVGMDVVKSKIAQLNGTVKVVSEFNVGCSIQIEIPIKLATMSVFLIQVSNQIFAIPTSVINTVICKKDDEIIKNNNFMTVIYNGKNIPVYYMSEILNLKQNEDNEDIQTYKTILIMETNNKTIGVIIDKLLGEQNILHKKLSPPIHKLKNISGITTLDSGETCLVLNISDIINSTLILNSKLNTIKRKSIVDKRAIAEYKKILFVDDSITSRTLGKNILSNYGFNVDVAENPVQAMKLLNKTTYDLIISDIEMPEMNGLEFLSEIKTNELYTDIPFVIMSSLGNENTKRQALKLGAKNFIVKSQFSKESLINIVCDILIQNETN